MRNARPTRPGVVRARARTAAWLLSILALLVPAASAVGTAGPKLTLHPPLMRLRDGIIEGRFLLHARDERGRPIDLERRAVTFTSDDPDLVQVDDDGTVRSTGLGTTSVTAEVAGLPGTATATVRAGRLEMTPAVLYLMPGEQAKLGVLAETADGLPVDASTLPITFHCSNGCQGSAPEIELSPDGTVRGLRPFSSRDLIPGVFATRSDVIGFMNALVIVVPEALGSPTVRLAGDDIAFYTPARLFTHDIVGIWEKWQATRVTDLAHRFLTELAGFPSHEGRRIALAHGYTRAQEGMQCGFAGNPIWLGTLSLLGNGISQSCFLDPDDESPHWGVFFHELGHDIAETNRWAGAFYLGDDPLIGYYEEEFANIRAGWAAELLRMRARKLGIQRRVVRSVLYHWGVFRDDTSQLELYLAQGADYHGIAGTGGGKIRGMMVELIREHGWGALYRFQSIFLPADEPTSWFVQTQDERANFFAAAWSAATGADLEARFRDEWGFPIMESLYAGYLRELEPAAALRDPVTDAGPARTIAVGERLLLDGARVIDYEGDDPIWRWRVIESPEGSKPSLGRRRGAVPKFRADVPGTYVIELEAGDDLVRRRDTVRVTVTASGS